MNIKNIDQILRSESPMKRFDHELRSLKEIHSAWQDLFNSISRAEIRSIKIESIAQSRPASLKNSVLSISCSSAAIASHIRFNSQELLNYLNAKIGNKIESIQLFIDPDLEAFFSKQTSLASNKTVTKRNVSLESIHHLEEFQQTFTSSSEKLNQSIDQLIKTLKKNH